MGQAMMPQNGVMPQSGVMPQDGVSFVPVGVQYGMSPNPIAYSDQHNPSAVAMTINGLLGSMSCDHISIVLAYLDPRLVVTLRECLDVGGMWSSNQDQHRYNDQ